jgi:hypothetical protein
LFAASVAGATPVASAAARLRKRNAFVIVLTSFGCSVEPRKRRAFVTGW